MDQYNAAPKLKLNSWSGLYLCFKMVSLFQSQAFTKMSATENSVYYYFINQTLENSVYAQKRASKIIP